MHLSGLLVVGPMGPPKKFCLDEMAENRLLANNVRHFSTGGGSFTEGDRVTGIAAMSSFKTSCQRQRSYISLQGGADPTSRRRRRYNSLLNFRHFRHFKL